MGVSNFQEGPFAVPSRNHRGSNYESLHNSGRNMVVSACKRKRLVALGASFATIQRKLILAESRKDSEIGSEGRVKKADPCLDRALERLERPIPLAVIRYTAKANRAGAICIDPHGRGPHSLARPRTHLT